MSIPSNGGASIDLIGYDSKSYKNNKNKMK